MTAPSTPALLPFWSDDFDMDLLTVLPEARGILGPTEALILHTHCGHGTYGRINCPNAWHSDQGLAAFFGFTGAAKPRGYYTGDLLVECTFLEAVRDEWVHGAVMIVEGQVVWQPSRLRESFDAVMLDRRGCHTISAIERECHLSRVRWSLFEARRRFERVARKAGMHA